MRCYNYYHVIVVYFGEDGQNIKKNEDLEKSQDGSMFNFPAAKAAYSKGNVDQYCRFPPPPWFFFLGGGRI